MRLRMLLVVMLVSLVVVGTVHAQGGSALVGSWERASLLDADGKSVQPPAPPAFLIFTASGHWSQVAIPAGRAKVNKPVDQLTREELVERFNRVEARRGTYTVEGAKLTRRNVTNTNASDEGTDQVQNFRIEGDMLILTSIDAKVKNEARFRRVR